MFGKLCNLFPCVPRKKEKERNFGGTSFSSYFQVSLSLKLNPEKTASACVKGIHPSLSLSCPMVPGV
jgi:hypothetical protein